MRLQLNHAYLNKNGGLFLITEIDPHNDFWPVIGYEVPLDDSWVANERSWTRQGRAGNPRKQSDDDLVPVAEWGPETDVAKNSAIVLSKCKRMTCRMSGPLHHTNVMIG